MCTVCSVDDTWQTSDSFAVRVAPEMFDVAVFFDCAGEALAVGHSTYSLFFGLGHCILCVYISLKSAHAP
jgi:hypothetical protein